MAVSEHLTSVRLRFGLLGPLRVTDETQETTVSSLLQRKILTALLLSPRAVVSAEALEFILWGDDLPKTSRKTLQTLVWRLRDLLGPGRIVTQPPGYMIDVDDHDIDAVVFERLVSEAEAILGDDPTKALSLIDRALGLWRGEPIAEFAGEEFAMMESHRLAELRLTAVELRFEALLALGRHESAIPELEAFVAQYPFREKPRSRLMTALYRSGRTSNALEVYRDFGNLMREELGLDPSPELQDLELRILNQDESLGSVALDTPAIVREPSTVMLKLRLPRPPVMVGRQTEIKRLTEMAREPLTTVVGPGGVGKTSLVSVWSDTQPNVSIVELADLSPEEDLIAGLAQQLGMDAQTSDPRASLIGRLAATGGTLVMDNCEHLLEAVRALVADVLRLAPEVRVICTSRQRLALPGEQVLVLEPLVVDGDPNLFKDPRANEAVRLFLDHAHRANSKFRIADGDLRAVAEICRLVNGLPLAIELAAARATVFGLNDLVDAISYDIAVLELGTGRHSSLADVLDWSIGLLDHETRSVLLTAALFEGGFTLDYLAKVHGRGNVTVNVGRLADASLIYRVAGSRPARFKLHVPTRIHLRESIGTTPETVERFVACWHAFTADVTGALQLPGESVSRRSLMAEIPNIIATAKAALALGDRQTAFEMAEMLGRADLIGSPAIAGLLDDIADSYEPDDGAFAVGGLAAAARSASIRGLQDDAITRAGRAEEIAGGKWHKGLYMATHARAMAAYFAGDPRRCIGILDSIVNDERVPLQERLVATLDQATAMAHADDLAGARRLAESAYETSLKEAGESVAAYGVFALGAIDLRHDPSAALEFFDIAIQRAKRAQSGLIERIAQVCRVTALMLLDRDAEALRETSDLIDALVISGNHSLSLVRVVAVLAMRAGDLETAAILAQSYETHPEAARYGTIVNATNQIGQLRESFTAQEWAGLGARAAELTRHDVVELVKDLAGQYS